VEGTEERRGGEEGGDGEGEGGGGGSNASTGECGHHGAL
jgi:hypothetical protein